MLYDLANLTSLSIRATDGNLGSVDDVYFDDERWTVRYFVVDTGGWLSPRKVLISPLSARRIDWGARMLAVDLSRDDVEGAPSIDTDKPVSRQQETAYADYYGFPYYWTGPYLWGLAPYPMPVLGGELDEDLARERRARVRREAEHYDVHLRSAGEVTGYRIVTPDGPRGRVGSFLFDAATWSVRAIIVETGDWLAGKQLMMPPEWVEYVDANARQLHVEVSQDMLEDSPEYDRGAPVDEDLPQRLEQLGRFRRRPRHAGTRPGS